MLLTAKIAVKLFSKLHVLIYLALYADTLAGLAALQYMCAIFVFLSAGKSFAKGPSEVSTFECTDLTNGCQSPQSQVIDNLSFKYDEGIRHLV